MIESFGPPVSRIAWLRDLAALGKPRLSLLVLFTAGTGVGLSPAPPSLPRTLAFLLATAGLVAAANTLNCWVEREIDALMHRTRERPLPAGRLGPRTALVFGIVLGAASLAALAATANPLTVLLGVVALLTYVLVYTPLKRLTPWAVFVGAVPGALPPLMGWTAATDTLAPPGWFVFGILFLWQLPHFIAISLYLKEDFRRGGIRVLPLARGERSARRWLVGSAAALVAFSLVAVPGGLGGAAYRLTAAVAGAVWLALALPGLRRSVEGGWARKVFGYSLLYLPVVIAVLVLDTF